MKTTATPNQSAAANSRRAWLYDFHRYYYVIRFGHVPIRRLWLSSGRYAGKSGTLMALCANLRMRAANGGIASLLQSTRLVAAVAELGPLIVT